MTSLYPSIDIRAGRVVRLAQGEYDRETVYDRDPVDVALEFVAGGARWIHVVDLDAARTGVGTNRGVVASVVGAVGGRAQVQAGGGVRACDDAVALADAGVARVVMGSAALADPALVEQVATRVPVAVGLDHRAGVLAVHGWTRAAALDARRGARPLPGGGRVRHHRHRPRWHARWTRCRRAAGGGRGH